jgi:hypothetical protein
VYTWSRTGIQRLFTAERAEDAENGLTDFFFLRKTTGGGCQCFLAVDGGQVEQGCEGAEEGWEGGGCIALSMGRVAAGGEVGELEGGDDCGEQEGEGELGLAGWAAVGLARIHRVMDESQRQ